MSEISLREYIETQLIAHNELHRQHEIAHDREHRLTETAIAKAEEATSAALSKADEVVTARFAAQNEWRAAMNDRERNFLSKAEYVTAHDSLKARIDALEDAGIARVAREQERERAQVRMMALVGLMAAVGGFLLSLLARLLSIG